MPTKHLSTKVYNSARRTTQLLPSLECPSFTLNWIDLKLRVWKTMKGSLVLHPKTGFQGVLISDGSVKTWSPGLAPRTTTEVGRGRRVQEQSDCAEWHNCAELCCLSPGTASSTGHTVLKLTLVKWPLQAGIWHLTHGARTQRALKQNIYFRFLRSLWNFLMPFDIPMPWHIRLGEPHYCVDTGLRHELMEAARASDQRIFEFESAPWHVLEVNVEHYLTFWSFSFPFYKME